jgi:hypothetical protein
VLDIKAIYHKGGMNYFTYKTEPRGYYMVISPKELTETGFMFLIDGSRENMGAKYLIEGATRLNRKRLTALMAAVDASAPAVAAAFRANDAAALLAALGRARATGLTAAA